MKDLRYYSFTPSSAYAGQQALPSAGNEARMLTGTPAQPGDCLKLAYGDAWEQEAQEVALLEGVVQVASLSEADWTPELKARWVNAYLRHCGVTELVGSPYLSDLLAYADDQGLFEQLSGVSVAYAIQDPETEVITLGVNAYELPWLRTYAPQATPTVQEIIARQHTPTLPLVALACKLTYRGASHVTWAFGGATHAYAVATPSPSLRTGGGNIFTQIQLGGLALRASYVLKARVDPDDPTMGLYSGRTDRFYTGEELVLVDTSVWTVATATDWTWVGDFTILPQRWYIADITNPGADYYKLPVDYLQFPASALGNTTVRDLG